MGEFGKRSSDPPSGVTSADKLLKAGIYMSNGLTNSPVSGQWFHYLVMNHLDTYVTQIAVQFNSDKFPVFIRVMRSGTWSAWRNFNPGTANAAQVLSGYTFSSANGSNLSGSMTNQGAKTSSLNCGGSYTIPAGYHNGSGKITANSLSSQTSGTAAASDILSGKTAWVSGSKRTGTMKNYSNVIQTATTNTNNQSASCYQVRDGYIAVVPAIGYWGSWNFDKCIRVPSSSTLKHIEGWVNASTSEYGWQWQNGSGTWNTSYMPYLTITFSFSHRVVTASAYHENYGNNQHIVGTNGHEYQLGRTSIIQTQKTHPNMMTDTYFYIAVDKNGGRYHYDIWYI